MLHLLPFLRCFWLLEWPGFRLCCFLGSTRHLCSMSASLLGCCTAQSRHPFCHTVLSFAHQLQQLLFRASRYLVQHLQVQKTASISRGWGRWVNLSTSVFLRQLKSHHICVRPDNVYKLSTGFLELSGTGIIISLPTIIDNK